MCGLLRISNFTYVKSGLKWDGCCFSNQNNHESLLIPIYFVTYQEKLAVTYQWLELWQSPKEELWFWESFCSPELKKVLKIFYKLKFKSFLSTTENKSRKELVTSVFVWRKNLLKIRKGMQAYRRAFQSRLKKSPS